MQQKFVEQGSRNRRRGADAERSVVNYLRQWWPEARRFLAGDGRQPGDIDAINTLCIEVKDCKNSQWPTWRAQAADEANERIPVVVRRTRGEPDVGNWIAHVPASMFQNEDVKLVYCKRTNLEWAVVSFSAVIEKQLV